MSVFGVYLDGKFERTFPTIEIAKEFQRRNRNCVISELIDKADEVRFLSYLTAERDGFSKDPEHYWLLAEKEIYSN